MSSKADNSCPVMSKRLVHSCFYRDVAVKTIDIVSLGLAVFVHVYELQPCVFKEERVVSYR